MQYKVTSTTVKTKSKSAGKSFRFILEIIMCKFCQLAYWVWPWKKHTHENHFLCLRHWYWTHVCHECLWFSSQSPLKLWKDNSQGVKAPHETPTNGFRVQKDSLCYQFFHTFILAVIFSSILGIQSRLNLLVLFAVLTEKRKDYFVEIYILATFSFYFCVLFHLPKFDLQIATKSLKTVKTV